MITNKALHVWQKNDCEAFLCESISGIYYMSKNETLLALYIKEELIKSGYKYPHHCYTCELTVHVCSLIMNNHTRYRPVAPRL